MNTKERSVWVIDKACQRLTKLHSHLFLIWTFYVVLISFHVFVYTIGAVSMEWHTTPILPLLGIWFLLVSLRPEPVLIWSCKIGSKLHPDTYPYLKKTAQKLAWDFTGRHI